MISLPPETQHLRSQIEMLQARVAKLERSEQELRLLVEHLRDLVSRTDVVGHFTYVSPSFTSVLGYDPQSLLGRIAFEFIHLDDVDAVFDTFTQAVAEGRPGEAEYRFQHADGHYVWMHTVGDVLKDDAGNITGTVLASRDVTERWRAAEALRASEARVRSYFQLPLVGLSISTLQKNFIEVNDRCCEILGYTAEELKQLSWEDITHPD
ncbi:MAG: PAS domain S-box protein, partial [Caldilineaceae bacterium]|nr:PAS domain S-box protein [Caldilineaceae bacterium]